MQFGLIGFGSNQGDPAAWLQQVIGRLESTDGLELQRVSQLRRTSPVGGPPDQPLYGNAAIRIRTGLGPLALFARLQQIEGELGRERRIRWAARTVDLDLLLLGGEIRREAGLVVPHPRMMYRQFALEPAAEIAGEQRHPVADRTLAELWRHLQTAPRRILMVTRDRELAAWWRTAGGEETGNWEREVATDLPVAETLEGFRLVIWDGAERPLEPGAIRVPSLELERDRNLATVRTEIGAVGDALRAMERGPLR